MTTHTVSWFERLEKISPQAMRQLSEGMAFHLTNPTLSVSQLMTLQWHYHRSALAYTFHHAEHIRRVELVPHQNYFLLYPPYGLMRTRPLSTWAKGHLHGLCHDALEQGQPIDPDKLAAAGITPRHFSRLLGLWAGQAEWYDLNATQLRHLDPCGMWQVVVTFPGLALHLNYRDAEAYGLTIGLLPSESSSFRQMPVSPQSWEGMLELAGLTPQDFPTETHKAGAA